MDYSIPKRPSVRPRIIIHGGAGNITRENLPHEAQQEYRQALLHILHQANTALSVPGTSALDIATYAVSQLEDNPFFNSGRGAVFNRAGRHELEASVMTSKGYRKRGVGVMKVTRAKNPIKLAREMLVRGERDDGGGALGHCQLEGETIDRLAEEWGLERVRPSYFWTRRRWDEHRRALGLDHGDEEYERQKREADGGSAVAGEGDDVGHRASETDDVSDDDDDATWDGREYLPQGTVGAVVLDGDGMLCVATSTGGLTNKLPGRIGDTPTLGSGFWSEQWSTPSARRLSVRPERDLLISFLTDCLPGWSDHARLPTSDGAGENGVRPSEIRAVAMSGTGNGDSFLRTNAVRTAAAIARFSGSAPTSESSNRHGSPSLQSAVTAVAGPNGILQRSAEDRWKKTGEGEGGIIGIDFVGGQGRIVSDFNCGGMFHAWIDDDGSSRVVIFRDER